MFNGLGAIAHGLETPPGLLDYLRALPIDLTTLRGPDKLSVNMRLAAHALCVFFGTRAREHARTLVEDANERGVFGPHETGGGYNAPDIASLIVAFEGCRRHGLEVEGQEVRRLLRYALVFCALNAAETTHSGKRGVRVCSAGERHRHLYTHPALDAHMADLTGLPFAQGSGWWEGTQVLLDANEGKIRQNAGPVARRRFDPDWSGTFDAEDLEAIRAWVIHRQVTGRLLAMLDGMVIWHDYEVRGYSSGHALSLCGRLLEDADNAVPAARIGPGMAADLRPRDVVENEDWRLRSPVQWELVGGKVRCSFDAVHLEDGPRHATTVHVEEHFDEPPGQPVWWWVCGMQGSTWSIAGVGSGGGPRPSLPWSSGSSPREPDEPAPPADGGTASPPEAPAPDHAKAAGSALRQAIGHIETDRPDRALRQARVAVAALGKLVAWEAPD